MSNLAEAYNQLYKQQLEELSLKVDLKSKFEKLQLEKVAVEQNNPEENTNEK